MMLIVFFSVFIVIELLLLIGLVFAWRKLHQWLDLVRALRIAIVDVKSAVMHQSQRGYGSLIALEKVLVHSVRFLPGWARWGVTVLRWMGKIKLQTS
jgi:hypothetical protein